MAPNEAPRVETTPAELFKLPDVSFAVIDGKMFLLDGVNSSPKEVIEDLKAMYQTQVDEIKHTVATEDLRAWQQEWERMIGAYERKLARSGRGVLVPNDFDRQAVVISGGAYAPVRLVRYNPNLIRGHISRFKELVRSIETGSWGEWNIEQFSKLKKALFRKTDGNVTAHISQSLIDAPVAVAYIDPRVQVANGFRTYHTFSDGRLCTGTAAPRVFYDAPDFVQNFNTINPYSPAQDHVRANDGSRSVHFYEFLKDEYVTEIKVEVGTWST